VASLIKIPLHIALHEMGDNGRKTDGRTDGQSDGILENVMPPPLFVGGGIETCKWYQLRVRAISLLPWQNRL